MRLYTRVNNLQDNSQREESNSQRMKMMTGWGEENTDVTVTYWTSTLTHHLGPPISITNMCQDVSIKSKKKVVEQWRKNGNKENQEWWHVTSDCFLTFSEIVLVTINIMISSGIFPVSGWINTFRHRIYVFFLLMLVIMKLTFFKNCIFHCRLCITHEFINFYHLGYSHSVFSVTNIIFNVSV